jgi:MFS transporter, PAT family, beta-lactamase induction signal transducer AmpG
VSLAERKWLRLATLVVLYVAQGIPWGFMATTIPAYLASRGLDSQSVGVALATTTLPYTFKWIWGPVIDAVTFPRFGRRRPWIVFAQLMMALTVVAMLVIGDLSTDLKLLAWMILIHTVFNALQDVSVDALAVDLLDDDERGRANGLMYGAKYGGGAIGGIGLASVIAYTSLETALVVQAAILLAIMLVPLLVTETNTPPPPRMPLRVIGRAFVEVFATRSAAVTILVMLTCTLALGIVTVRANVLFTQELGWSPQKYAGLVGGWGLVAGGLTAASAGFVADALGPKRLAMLASLAMAAGWLVFSLNDGRWTDDRFVYAMALWETIAQAAMLVSLFALCMQVSLPAIGATQFAAYMALSNFGTTIGYRSSGLLADLSAIETWRLAAAFQVVVTLLLLAVDPAQTRRELPRSDASSAPVRGALVLGALAAFLVGMTGYIVYGII